MHGPHCSGRMCFLAGSTPLTFHSQPPHTSFDSCIFLFRVMVSYDTMQWEDVIAGVKSKKRKRTGSVSQEDLDEK